MIDAGSGFPPHWRGEGGDVNVATAEAMQAPPEKFLMKRQQYFVWLLEDILYQAFVRSALTGSRPLPQETSYQHLFTVDKPDVSLRDNAALADGSRRLSESFSMLQNTLLGNSETSHRIAVDLVLKFAGEAQEDEVLDKIIEEVKANPIEPTPLPGGGPNLDAEPVETG
jgi:hypothetical protein